MDYQQTDARSQTMSESNIMYLPLCGIYPEELLDNKFALWNHRFVVYGTN